ncbi:TetR family transcriptional regulator [Mucilaginibacter frigoritolerans]|jgi:AcrR family transcriptional regulator|uniref:TetR family transcriptional regulator n=1 Tax=Mucilaginibacter frigoritolerans TaxID=652788 RepID=A0A562TWY6_9SPHI|nr:TetR/AcrR family transcriptional regulator [Mucilaginibacter frigoritolerans]TWI97624.1 TetR family transcriptional regulator [Mucilaginibacter frigoritolerans]
MDTDSLSTSDFILQKVAPIFNRQGYAGTSLSDLTKATGLTKGAIYFNFKNKEALAVKAFKLNVKKVIAPIGLHLAQHDNAIEKLKALTIYHRTYYDVIAGIGGCPILNVCTDANNTNETLFNAVKIISKRLENDLIRIIQNGIDDDEIRADVNAAVYGKNIYAMIEGSIFLAFTHLDRTYIDNMMDMIDLLIDEKLTK